MDERDEEKIARLEEKRKMKGSEGEGEREEGREKCSMGHVVRRARDNQCGDVTVYPTNRGIAPFKPGSLGLRVESRRVPSGFSPTAVRPRSLRRANSRLDPLLHARHTFLRYNDFDHRKRFDFIQAFVHPAFHTSRKIDRNEAPRIHASFVINESRIKI